MSDLLSQAIGHIEDVTDVADRAIINIDVISTEIMRLQSKGVRLPRRLLRLIALASSPECATDALDRADEFVSAMELQGIKS